jgi:glycolate oxidase FAD binding subunit
VALPGLLSQHCALERLENAAPLWQQAMTGAALKGTVRWDVHLPPRAAPALIAALPEGAGWAMDWGGGRVWIATDAEDEAVRDLAAGLGGEARLVAAPEAMRARVPAFHPRARGVLALEARVRRAFDPKGVFATGRFAEDADADALHA